MGEAGGVDEQEVLLALEAGGRVGVVLAVGDGLRHGLALVGQDVQVVPGFAEKAPGRVQVLFAEVDAFLLVNRTKVSFIYSQKEMDNFKDFLEY